MTAIAVWLAIAVYGIFVQRLALTIAWRNMKTASFFGATSGAYVLAIAHVRSNAIRLFVVSANAFLGVFVALVQEPSTVQPPRAALLGWVFSGVLVVNELAMVTNATLEVLAQRRLRKRVLR